MGGLEPIPIATEREAGYTLSRSPVFCRPNSGDKAAFMLHHTESTKMYPFELKEEKQ